MQSSFSSNHSVHFFFLSENEREKERKERVVISILTYQLTVVCQSVRVDISRDAIIVTSAYIWQGEGTKDGNCRYGEEIEEGDYSYD